METSGEQQRRLIITDMVLENFKSYAGEQRVGPFHKVSCIFLPHFVFNCYTFQQTTSSNCANDLQPNMPDRMQFASGRPDPVQNLQSFSSVVGPNGSGKSNVIDAMLFVFGKKAKQVKRAMSGMHCTSTISCEAAIFF